MAWRPESFREALHTFHVDTMEDPEALIYALRHYPPAASRYVSGLDGVHLIAALCKIDIGPRGENNPVPFTTQPSESLDRVLAALDHAQGGARELAEHWRCCCNPNYAIYAERFGRVLTIDDVDPRNAPEALSWTLMHAACKNHVANAEWLTNTFALTWEQIRSWPGEDPLWNAIFARQIDMAEWLLASDFEVSRCAWDVDDLVEDDCAYDSDRWKRVIEKSRCSHQSRVNNTVFIAHSHRKAEARAVRFFALSRSAQARPAQPCRRRG